MVIQCIQLLHAQGMATKSAKFSKLLRNTNHINNKIIRAVSVKFHSLYPIYGRVNVGRVNINYLLVCDR